MQRPKFSIQKKTMDFTSKLRYVVEQTTCKKHDAGHGEPCWWTRGDQGSQLLAGICGPRSRQIYVGDISNQSTNKRPQKETR